MQNEQPEENDATSDEQKAHEKRILARSILSEAITALGIKDISEYQGEPLNLRWHVYSQNIQGDPMLRILIQGVFGVIDANVHLMRAINLVINEIELILNK